MSYFESQHCFLENIADFITHTHFKIEIKPDMPFLRSNTKIRQINSTFLLNTAKTISLSGSV